MIISRTPFRVSFYGGAVLATTIDKYCYISVRELPPFFDHRFRVVYSIVENVKDVADIAHPAVRAVLQRLEVDKGLEIHHDGDLPARSGLGSSSAFTVGLLRAIHALRGRHMSKEALASEAIHVEQCMLREPVGLQDQISAAFGGFNHILFRQDGTYEVEPMILPRERLAALEDHLMLVFTGISRLAPVVAQTVIDNLKQRSGELKAMLTHAPDVRLITYPGVGHPALEEAGALIARDVAAYLDGTLPAS
jgi:D-glycero-alpha-D-manno-heptose-7-phosphate kinase